MSGLPPAELEARLRVLVRPELLHEELDPRSPERGQYGFVQALIREVAYSTLSMRDRRARHLAAARYFESLGDEELAGALAAHYLAAYRASPDGPEAEALASQARVALRAAADRARALGAPIQAMSFLEQAVEVASDDAERASLLESAAESAALAARSELALPLVARAEALRTELGDTAALAWNQTVRARALYLGRQRESSRELAASALERFADLGPEHPTIIDLKLLLARSAVSTGHYDEALEAAEDAIVVAERLGLANVVAEALVLKGMIYFYRGRLWEARAVLEGARIVAQNFSLPEVELRAIHNLGLGIGLDDPRASVELQRAGIALARRLGERSTEILLLGNAAEDARRTGDWDWALAELEAAIQLDIDAISRRSLQVVQAGFLAYRGALSPERYEALKGALQGGEDADSAAGTHDVDATVAAAGGDWRAAHDHYVAMADASLLNAPYVLPAAGLFATLASEADLARAALARLDAMGTRGRAVAANRLAIEAGIAALEGDRMAALNGYRQAIAVLRELGLRVDEAWVTMAAMARVGADEPETLGWATRSADFLDEVGATPIAAQLGVLVNRSPSAGSPRAAGSSAAGSGTARETPASS